jgi:putative MATE family efflux protein
MRKNVIISYLEGVFDTTAGDSYAKILRYFYPEFVSSLVLYSALYLLDARFIADLESTPMYATLGLSNTFLHFIVKIAEASALSVTVLCGQFNGAGKYSEVGRAFVEAFWVVVVVGASIAAFLFFGAYYIYYFLGVPANMIYLGVPFLRLRAIGIFLMFVYLACAALMRALKNTRMPMYIFGVGAVLFIFFDYILIFGYFGFPQLGLMGSAWATVVQYAVMVALAMGGIMLTSYRTTYHIRLFSGLLHREYIVRIFSLSWPMIIDKATVAGSYIWLGKMIAPMGMYAIASYTVIKDMERFAFLPAVALAQIITFLVSNDFGKHNWRGISANIKRVVFLSSIMVFILLLTFSLYPDFFIHFFDPKRAFTQFAARIFPLLSVFVFFDLVQLIFSGALRGAGDVRMVMWTRLIVCIGFICPVTYAIAVFVPSSDLAFKFFIMYASFYIGSAIMSIVYVRHFRTGNWSLRETQKESL